MYKILVVDDNPSQTELITHMLSTMDVTCIKAHTGKEAVKIAKNQQPDLIIMDWIMPTATLSGDEATRTILGDKMTHHIPVVACSAVVDNHSAMDLGCVDFIQKPFCRSYLIDKIQQHLI